MGRSFLEKLNALTSLKKKQQLINTTLQLIGTGTARKVYKFEDKVLKVAKDKRGIAQNKEEYNVSKENNKIFTIVFDAAPDFSWILAERAEPCTEQKFKSIYGISYDDFYGFMFCLEMGIKPGTNPRKLLDTLVSKQFKVPMIDVFVAWHQYKRSGDKALNKYHLSNKCGNFLTRCYQYKMSHPEFVADELATMENVGIVNRDNKLSAIIIDSGMNEDILFRLYDGK